MRGDMNLGDNRGRSRVVGVAYVCMDYDPGIEPSCSQMTETVCTISDKHFRLKIEPEIRNRYIFSKFDLAYY